MLNRAQKTAGIAIQKIATKSKGKTLPSQKKRWLGIGLGNRAINQIW
ncbi:hypothetical protein [Pectobacterium brasiliense]|nr:hypothetical protein [Pectobacterium brasiliense]AFR02824.1 hypothetical protein PCC21_014210 [Pectobacterium carotovorum subsp. carotovorum PCC21]